jgi:hypothetical protein
MGTRKGLGKYIESPERMWELFQKYKKEVKSNPILVKDWVGKDGDQVYREKERPLTDKGFFNFCRRNVGCVKQYFDNQDKLYTDYISICSHIREEIDQDQIEGGMAGIYNPSITQRLNNLTDKVESKQEITQITIKRD